MSMGGSYSGKISLESTISSSYSPSSPRGNYFNKIHSSIQAEPVSASLSYDALKLDSESGYSVNLDSLPEIIPSDMPGQNYAPPKANSKNDVQDYSQKKDEEENQPAQTYQPTITVGLLKSNRPVTQFINQAAEVQSLVIETFETLTKESFPSDIEVNVCSEEEMKKAHESFGGKWHKGILGFAINPLKGIKKVFVIKNHLDALMLTIGHELGHVLTPRLENELNEEAKAFAFELAWMKTIIEHNIGTLAECFDPNFNPAQNGLHDVAFNFIANLKKTGKEAIDTFKELAKGILTVPKPTSKLEF